MTGISTETVLADVQARARQSGTGGRCLYHITTRDIGSDGVAVEYDASGAVVDLACHQVKFLKSPDTQVKVKKVTAAAERSIANAREKLGYQGKVEWHFWYFGRGYNPPKATTLEPLTRALAAKCAADVHWHGAAEVFRALPPLKQTFMRAVQKAQKDAYPCDLPADE